MERQGRRYLRDKKKEWENRLDVEDGEEGIKDEPLLLTMILSNEFWKYREDQISRESNEFNFTNT